MKNRFKRITLFDCLNTALLLLIGFVGLCPFVHLLAVAFSSGAMSSQYLVTLWPLEFSTEAFREVLSDTRMLTAAGISLERVALGTSITMLLTILTAYPVSVPQREFGARRFYVVFMVITMMFGGGLIPDYMLKSRLGMMNSIWVLVIPGAIPIANVILIMNFFRGIPGGIREAGMIDGASDFGILTRLYVPLSLPCFATLITFCIIGHWNAWFDGMLFMRNADLYPLQTFLQAKFVPRSYIKIKWKRYRSRCRTITR